MTQIQANPVPDLEEETGGQAGDMQWGFYGAETRDDSGLSAVQRLTAKDTADDTAPKEAKDPAAEGAGGKAQQLIDIAKTQLGVKYVYGARQWGKALDCSGFTQQAMKQLGIDIGGDTYTQVTQGQDIGTDLGAARPGDLVFFTGDIGMRRNGHVGIYLGNGQFIHAPRTGKTVEIAPIGGRSVTAIRRFL